MYINYYMVAYDETYDPFCNELDGSQEYCNSDWLKKINDEIIDNSSLEGEKRSDITIIGGGLSGLSTAYYLLEKHGIKATILEKNKLFWGCSSRSGGQAQAHFGRISKMGWVSKYGPVIANKLYNISQDNYETAKELINKFQAEAKENGHLRTCIKGTGSKRMITEAKRAKELFAFETNCLSKDEVKNYVNDRQAIGGIYEKQGISIQPAKLANKLAKYLVSKGVEIYSDSGVNEIEKTNDEYTLVTDKGLVETGKVVIATGSYGAGLEKIISNQIIPVLANNSFTRELNSEELEKIGLNKDFENLAMTDSYFLRHYFRVVDDRLQIGTRDAIFGKGSSKKKVAINLSNIIKKKFDINVLPNELNIWHGWVDVSTDMMPKLLEVKKDLYYTGGYCGNGISTSIGFAKMLAGVLAGEGKFNIELPIHKFQKEYAFLNHIPSWLAKLGQRTFETFLTSYYILKQKK